MYSPWSNGVQQAEAGEKPVQGIYRDLLTGPSGRVRHDSGWRPNLVVRSAGRLIAALMKDPSTLGGIRYLAVGEGEREWDFGDRTPVADTQTLCHEVARPEVKPENIVYLDEQCDTEVVECQVSDQPTAHLEISVVLRGADLALGIDEAQPLREFGLFGGDATAAAGSGYLIDYVVHPRIDLTPQMTLTRQIRLRFWPPAADQPPATGLPAHWLAGTSVEHLDGVGSRYLQALEQADVDTLGQLAESEPAALSLTVPPMKLVELRAKARLTLHTAAALSLVWGLKDCTVQEILSRPIAELKARASDPPQEVEKLREQVGVLQLALDHRFLGERTLRQLIEGD